MGKIVEHISQDLIPSEPDRHANRVQVYRTKARLVHINFRNLQIRLTREEFEKWQKGFAKALTRLGDRMANDTLEPWPDEPKQRRRRKSSEIQDDED